MLSCAGNDYVETPAMDALAAEGVRFERAYCTNPVCVPSRFSLMTGRMPSAIGLKSNERSHIPEIPDVIKRNGLGHLMRRAGYEAAYGGKVHLPKLCAEDIGFNVISTNERGQLADTCATFIRQDRDRPFFLVASFINPHDICYMTLVEHAQNEREKRLVERGELECETLQAALQRPQGVDEEAFFAAHCPSLPPNFEVQEEESEAVRQLLDRSPCRKKTREAWSERRWREHRWAYARLTERVDRQVGRVLDALRESGRMENTLVVFTSDHGDMDGAHRLASKIIPYEEVCRIPLIIRAPGQRRDGRVDRTHLVSNGLDLLPTFCDWAGVEPPRDLVGRSLRPLVEGEFVGDWCEGLPVESEIGRAVVTDRFKYVVYDPGANREQFYDLECDPGETRNALHDPAFRQDLDSLRGSFREWFGDGV